MADIYDNHFDANQTALLVVEPLHYACFPPSSIDDTTNVYFIEQATTIPEAAFSPESVYDWLWSEDKDTLIPDHRESISESTNSSIETTSERSEAPTPSSEKLHRRKQQNRNAQRAFRERKDRRVYELEESARTSRARATELELENHRLERLVEEKEIQIQTLRSVSLRSEAHRVHDVVGPQADCTEITCNGSGVLLLRINQVASGNDKPLSLQPQSLLAGKSSGK